jgi:hypothetical protein
MDDDSIIVDELVLMAFNIRREVCGVLDPFLSILTKYKNKNTHNMIYLMLDHRFKNLHIIFSFVGCEQGVNLVEEYDRKSLYPIFVKWV